MRAMVVVLSMRWSCHGDGTAPPDVTSGGRADQSVATGGSVGSRFRKRRTGSGGAGASASPGQGRFSGPDGWGDALMTVPSGRGAACASGGSRVSAGTARRHGSAVPRSPGRRSRWADHPRLAGSTPDVVGPAVELWSSAVHRPDDRRSSWGWTLVVLTRGVP